MARLCGLREPGLGAVTVADFANYIDSIDQWLKIEMQAGGMRLG